MVWEFFFLLWRDLIFLNITLGIKGNLYSDLFLKIPKLVIFHLKKMIKTQQNCKTISNNLALD